MGEINGKNGGLSNILGLFMRPLRKIKTILVTKESSKERTLEESTEETVIGQASSINTTIIKRALFYHCGHHADNNVGGRCVCGAIVCKSCLSLCSICGIPLCPVDTITVEGERYCRECFEDKVRRERLKAVGRALGSFFVERGGER